MSPSTDPKIMLGEGRTRLLLKAESGYTLTTNSAPVPLTTVKVFFLHFYKIPCQSKVLCVSSYYHTIFLTYAFFGYAWRMQAKGVFDCKDAD